MSESSGRMSTAVPARFRLPEAPTPFHGRATERARLSQAIARAPVTGLFGPDGIGKTGTLLHVIQHDLEAFAKQALRISLRPAETTGEVHLCVLQALAEARQITRIDWGSLAGDVDAITATILDLAESGPHLVILEEAHRADRWQLRDLVVQLARYAKRSRWVVVSREEVAIPGFPGQSVGIGPMKTTELRELAERLAPEGNEAQWTQAAEGADGSPWKLQRLLSVGGFGEGTLEDLLSSLSPSARETTERFALLEVAVTREQLNMLGTITDEEVQGLIQQGLYIEHGERLTVHENLREAAAKSPGRSQLSRDTGTRLSQALESELQLEAIRLLSRTRDEQAVADLVARIGDSLLADGHASTVWQSIESLAGAAVWEFRMRCALQLGDRRAIKSARLPADASRAQRMVWAQVLWARSQAAESMDVASEIQSEACAENDPRGVFEAGMLRARCLVHLGRTDEARACLLELEPTEADDIARCEVLKTHCARMLGHLEEAKASALALRENVVQMRDSHREETIFVLAHACFELGLIAESRELLETLLRPDSGWSVAVYSARQALLLYAAIALLEGRLDAASNALQQLEPYVARSSHLRSRVRLAQALRRMLKGDFARFEEALSENVHDAGQMGHPDVIAIANALSVNWATLNGFSREDHPRLFEQDERASRARPDLVRYVELEYLHHALRRDEGLDLGAEHPEDTTHPGLGTQFKALLAVRALLNNDSQSDLLADQAVAWSRDAGYRSHEADALAIQGEIALCHGDLRKLSDSATELADMADHFGSARYAAAARMLRLASEKSLSRPAVLEPLAAMAMSAPVVARRAQALMGGRPRLDKVDEKVVAAIRQHCPIPKIEVVHAEDANLEEWMVGWGLDERYRSVWLEDGRIIDLSRRALLFRLLTSIADLGGTATKEDIVIQVWEEEEYHPLNHDNRLHSAVRKLRRLIEDDPADPRRITTTPDGYALGLGARRVRASS